MKIRIYHAGRADAAALAQLAEATFRSTFGTSNTAEDMEGHCRASYGEAIQLAQIRDPACSTLLLTADGSLAGYAQLRRGAVPDCVQARRAGEIWRFYLLPHCHGSGAAARLMSACLDELRRHDCDVAWLGVWEHNPRAIAFYRKHGFATLGEHVFLLGQDPQRDLIMARAVDPEITADAP